MCPDIIQGGVHIDSRGVLSFINDFDFKGVDRFYTIKSHQIGVARGWVGHKIEHKWFVAFSGSILISVVAPDNWESPSSDLPVEQFVLSSLKPSCLVVPGGYATASISLTNDALLGVFSSGKIQDAASDDWRFDISSWRVKE